MFKLRYRLLRFRFKGLAETQHGKTLNEIRLSDKQVEKILFLCYGNICRSPMAEKLAMRLLPKVEVSSAGFYEREGRSTPDEVQSAAESLGINLSDCASKRVTREMVQRADLVVLMDLYNFRDFRREFPGEETKVLFLGLLLDPPQLGITDPYGKAPDEIARILSEIEKGVTALAKEISTSH
jgi:protein-tyrosine-phosphatase